MAFDHDSMNGDDIGSHLISLETYIIMYVYENHPGDNAMRRPALATYFPSHNDLFVPAQRRHG